jgi:hypothetical protein
LGVYIDINEVKICIFILLMMRREKNMIFNMEYMDLNERNDNNNLSVGVKYIENM